MSLAVVALWFASGVGRAENIPLPNPSFENPSTNFVALNIDHWQKSPQPAGYDETGGFLWDFNIGVFRNTEPGAFDHLDNIDGTQALYLFSVPGAAIFQDYDTVDYNDTVPSRAFNAKFEPGKFYSLTVAVNGGGGGMPAGAPMEISLYYRDAQGHKVTVGATTVIHSLEAFPVHTHFWDYQVRVPVVKPADAWAGKNIGIQFRSTVSDEMQGGYWDLDFVRLASGPDPVTITRQGSDLRVAWPTIAGYQYQLESCTEFGTWGNEGPAVLGTGSEEVRLYPVLAAGKKFYRVQVTDAP